LTGRSKLRPVAGVVYAALIAIAWLVLWRGLTIEWALSLFVAAFMVEISFRLLEFRQVRRRDRVGYHGPASHGHERR